MVAFLEAARFGVGVIFSIGGGLPKDLPGYLTFFENGIFIMSLLRGAAP
jgi:hypothetical protein